VQHGILADPQYRLSDLAVQRALPEHHRHASPLDHRLVSQLVSEPAMKHKIQLTRVLTQVIEIEVDLPAEADCTDGVILGSAKDVASEYFDTDWRTRQVRYSYEMAD
jgi:hypothetical protein